MIEAAAPAGTIIQAFSRLPPQVSSTDRAREKSASPDRAPGLNSPSTGKAPSAG
jgi:hypothetical protein